MPVSLGKCKIKFFQPALFTSIVSPRLGLLTPGRGFCSLPILAQVAFTLPCHPQFSSCGGITVQRIWGSGEDPSCQLRAQPPPPSSHPDSDTGSGPDPPSPWHPVLVPHVPLSHAFISPFASSWSQSPWHLIALNLFYIKHPLRNLQLEVKIIMIIKKW